MKTVHTPRRRVALPAAERDGRDPRGIPKLNPVKALKQAQRHRFFPRKQTRGAISRRAGIASCAGPSSKTYPPAWSIAESGPQRPTLDMARGAPIAYGPRTVRLHARGCRPSVGPAPPRQGGRRRPCQDDAVADGFHPYAGGRVGSRARLGAKIRRKVAATEMAEAPAEPSPPVIASATRPARRPWPLPERL